MDWSIVRLGDVTRNLDSRRKPLNAQQRKAISLQGLYPYIGANNIMGYVDEFLFDEEILCIAEDGGSWGKNEVCAKVYTERCWVNNHAHVIGRSDGVELKYLMYCLNYTDLSSLITGTTRGKLTKGALNSLQIPLPPLETQRAIAAKLDAADRLRQLDQQLLTKYDELAQALFIDLFGDPVKNEKGWAKTTLSSVVSSSKWALKRGPFGGALKKEIFVSQGVKVYEQKNAIGGDWRLGAYYITQEKYKEMLAFSVGPGDFIVSCSGTIGALYQLTPDAPIGIINQALMKITLNEDVIHPIFFTSVFKYFIKEHIFIDSAKGSGLQNVSAMSIIKSGEFILPPIAIQDEYAKRIRQIEEQKVKLEKSRVKAESLWDSLLHSSFRN